MELDPQTVLIVDDDELLRDALTGLLTEYGFKVTAPETPAKVKPLLDRRSFAVGLIDLRMPGIDGLEILRYLRTFSPATQCVVMTGYATRDSAIEALNLGAYGYLRKPFEMDQLRVTVRRASERVAAAQELGRERAEKSRGVAARTRRLRAETEALNRRLKTMDRFLRGLAQALTAALKPIGGECLAAEGTASGAPSAAREKIGLLLRLAENLEELAQIQSGHRTAQREPVAVAEFLRRCGERFAAEYPGAPQPLIREILPGETLFTDPEIAVRILVELAGHARDRAGNRPVLLDAMRSENRFRLSISWEGAAVSEEVLHRVRSGDFLPENPAPEDIDLSFPIAWRLAGLLDGQISVESRGETGNRLTLSLPGRQASDSPAPVCPAPAETADEPPAKAGILLAEDNPESATVMADYLRSRGYAVHIARNGREAVDRARRDPPDLILMDVQMPDMDGLEAIRHIRADPELRFIPVIAITALAMAGDRERCLASGANAYMSKPVRLRCLLESVESLLSSTWETFHGRCPEYSDC
jgi:CheY-like chemotaxis protein